MAFKNIGAGWIKKGKKQSYISAQITLDSGAKMKLFIFKNDRKTKDTHPDYTISAPTDEEVAKPQTTATPSKGIVEEAEEIFNG